MPALPKRRTVGALTRAEIEAKGVKPDDIDSRWMDDMVKRLFKQLHTQLARIEATKPEDGDTRKASVRAANIRALDTLERTLERLARMERERTAGRTARETESREQIRARIQHRINLVLAYRGEEQIPAEPRP
ncbi:MAG TPA: hypothetical protein VG819_10155 [Rhizomicrobium sp.]|jgi:hypothetical protein|nr:hypothetical protein [Rhizomicrobium sp.]